MNELFIISEKVACEILIDYFIDKYGIESLVIMILKGSEVGKEMDF